MNCEKNHTNLSAHISLTSIIWNSHREQSDENMLLRYVMTLDYIGTTVFTFSTSFSSNSRASPLNLATPQTHGKQRLLVSGFEQHAWGYHMLQHLGSRSRTSVRAHVADKLSESTPSLRVPENDQKCMSRCTSARAEGSWHLWKWDQPQADCHSGHSPLEQQGDGKF